MTEAFKRGKLIDALITCHETFNLYDKTVTDRFGKIDTYTSAELQIGYKKRDSFFADALCKQIHAASYLQKEVKNEGVDFNNDIYACSCICDGMLKSGKWPWDIKSTSAASSGAFIDVFTMWDWDRQAFFFMEVCEADKMLFIGIENKSPHKIYKYWVNRGDDVWLSGQQKTLDLILKFDILCGNE